ncbi:diadenylate cyclase [Candidatus Woesearchaeota archaeon]|nr:diadenylate cyclase [Candidatus Woesearchaeota archaeon]
MNKNLLGQKKIKGITLKTIEEIDQIKNNNYGLSYDVVHAAASVSRILGRYVDYVQFETPKKPAYIILLDFNEKNLQYLHGGVTGIAEKYIGKKFTEVMKGLLIEMGNCDGAVVVGNDGKVLRVGAQLTKLDTKKIIRERKKEYGDLGSPGRLLGFANDVGTRHTSALVASYQNEGTKVVTLSEETGDLRVYENGRIIASSNVDDRIHELKKVRIENKPTFLGKIAALSMF